MLVASALGLGACAARSAQPPPRIDTMLSESRPVHAVFSGGFGAPVGLLGMGLGARPTPWSSVEVGVGAAIDGPQAALSAGLHLVGTRHALGLTSGLSAGAQSIDSDGVFDEYAGETVSSWDRVLWSNTTLQARRAVSDSAALRLDVGVAIPLAHSEPHCSGECGGRRWSLEAVPIFGVGLEYYLD